MKKLLFITTGGTIACDGREKNGYYPVKNGESLLSCLEGICDYRIIDLYSIDSTDIEPAHFLKLYKAVSDNLPLYDGIVILHGTDTMAYTGAFLGLTVMTDKPVILTGAMLPEGAPGSDAADNMIFAAKTASDDERSGVWLAFCGRIIRGEDIVKISSSEKDAFRSYSGFYAEKVINLSGDMTQLNNFPVVIKLSPFTKAGEIISAINPCGIVIEAYGAGGIPAGETVSAVRTAAEKTRVMITTPCLGGTDLEKYDVGKRALSAGALSSKGMSTECAAVYLWLTRSRT